MSAADRDYGEVLRHALHAAAESVEPAADGLERIRERIGPPPLLSFAMVIGWYSDIAVRFTTWAQPAIESFLDLFWSTVDRFRPSTEPGHARSRYAWLRPAAAMGTAIFVVAAGAFAVMTLPQAISSSGSISLPWTQHASTGGGGTSAVHSASQLPSGSGSGGLSGVAGGGSPSASSRCARPGHSPSGSASPSPSTSGSSPPTSTASASPSVSPSSSPPPATTSPSPSSTDSGDPDPGSETTPSPSASSAAISSSVLSLVAGPSAAAEVAAREAVGIAAALEVPHAATKSPSPSVSPCSSVTPRGR